MPQQQWTNLLLPMRLRDSAVVKHTMDSRNPFDSDYARIISSAPFRRLQDKAQVFPLEKNDFIRTRLTHSLEVSNFARGLGLSVENQLIACGKLAPQLKGYIPSLLATVGLVHDIGNPPFGHFGEDVIQNYFTQFFAKHYNAENDTYFGEHWTAEELADFTKFDGNVQGLRILRKLNLSKDEYSYNLTYPVLASMVKYPRNSVIGNKKTEKLSFKKFGYFQSEKDDFEKINQALQLNNNRHPLVFLLEAADDIAYSIADIEDGCKKGIITEELLLNILHKHLVGDVYESVIADFDRIKKSIPNDFPNKIQIIIQEFRVVVQTKMIEEAAKTFMLRLDAISTGEFDEDLLEASEAKNIRKVFKELSYHNFNHPSVLKRELAGEQLLNYLLTAFTNAIITPQKKSSKMLLQLLSANYTYVRKQYNSYPNQSYNDLQLITDFISSMTDSYALSLYHELTGQTIK
ncbi:MAG: dGTP triphosphohydrolase [Bacteroidia bacterium]